MFEKYKGLRAIPGWLKKELSFIDASDLNEEKKFVLRIIAQYEAMRMGGVPYEKFKQTIINNKEILK